MPSSQPLVTVGIAYFNAAPFVRDAITSVLAQSYRHFELLLVDDGSQDASRQVVESIHDPRIRRLPAGARQGLAGRLNQISRAASGVYIARMDADDIMHPERLERQVAFLQANARVDVVGTEAYVIDEHNRPLGYRASVTVPDVRTALRRTCFIHPSVMGRRAWFARHPYDRSIVRAEDIELWVRSFEQSNFAILREPLLFYREFGMSSANRYVASARAMRQVVRRHAHACSRVELWHLLATSYLKEITYRAIAAGNAEHLLHRRRNTRLTANERRHAECILSRVFVNTETP